MNEWEWHLGISAFNHPIRDIFRPEGSMRTMLPIYLPSYVLTSGCVGVPFGEVRSFRHITLSKKKMLRKNRALSRTTNHFLPSRRSSTHCATSSWPSCAVSSLAEHALLWLETPQTEMFHNSVPRWQRQIHFLKAAFEAARAQRCLSHLKGLRQPGIRSLWARQKQYQCSMP